MLKNCFLAALLVAALGVPTDVGADVTAMARCQRRIATAGARFAQRTIQATLKCTQEITECQIQCEQGGFGPPCATNPPPCCDPEDPESNEGFGQCMDAAQEVCDRQTQKIADFEESKQARITAGCESLTQEELCGSELEGLNFAALNAGCLALDPNYVCTLNNLIECVGGPLERALVDQISAVLAPTAGDAIAALNLQSQFPDIPIARKVAGEVAEGKADVYTFTGVAGEEIGVSIRTRDDNGNATSNLNPTVTLIGSDLVTPVADTIVRFGQCSVASVCGAQCPQFKRSLPFDGTFFLAIEAVAGGGCTGGRYRLVLVSPGGTIPMLVLDDVDAGSF